MSTLRRELNVWLRKKVVKKPTKAQLTAEEKSRKQVWAVVLFAVGVLLFFLTFVKGDGIWQGLHNLLFGLFGWGSYFLAPIIIYLAVLSTQERPLAYIQGKMWQSFALVLLISGTINIFTGLPKTEGFAYLVREVYQNGAEGKGGGVLGLLTAGPISLLGSKPVPQIIIILIMFVFFMLVTGSTLMGLYRLIRKPVDSLGEGITSIQESRQQQQEAKKAQEMVEQQSLEWKDSPEEAPSVPEVVFKSEPKFNIDVDISRDKTPKELGEEVPIEPIMEALKDTTINRMPAHDPEDFFAGWGVDNPVEYLNIKTNEAKNKGTEQFQRPHPLEADIEEAAEDDVLFAVQAYLDSIKTDDDFPETSVPHEPAPTSQEYYEPPNIETFKANLNTYDEYNKDTSDTYEFSIIRPDMDNFYAKPEPDKEVINAIYDPVTADKGTAPVYDVVSKNVPSPPPQILSIPEDEGNPWESIVTMYEKNSPKDVVTEKTVAKQVHTDSRYRLPPLTLLNPIPEIQDEDISVELKQNAEKLVATLESFGVKTKIIDVARGPSVTRYELQPSPGVKISRITGLADDIALNLAAAGIRIEAPIPNKAAVGIEIPNRNVSIVSFKEIVGSPDFVKSSADIGIALGKDITGKNIIADIAKMPHMLIAGATGSGKSVCINAIIMSILYKYSPDEVKLLMVDPKVVELGIYNGIPHLLVPVVTDPKKAAGALSWAVQEMLKRYATFAENSVRDIRGYNKLSESGGELEYMPKIVVIIDELADLMMAAPGEVEDSIMRLAQMARAAGMHLVIATQRPSVDVITGVIKANIPSRIAFAVSSAVDSRTILDGGGAEKLLGRGDMLFYPIDAPKPVRVQGCFVTDKEVEKVVAHVKASSKAQYDEDVVDEIERLAVVEKSSKSNIGGGFDDEDEMIPYAIEVVMEAGQASTSMLQRRLKLGYARAARIIDQLEARGIVGPFEGSKPRQVLISTDQYTEMKLAGLDKPHIGE